MLSVWLIPLTVTGIGAVYLIDCLLVRRWLRPQAQSLLVYVTTMAALGVLGEVLFDTVYTWVAGRPLWEYHLFPIHHGYTSAYSLVLWGAMGLHMHLLHAAPVQRRKSIHTLAALFCLEAILLEVYVNMLFLAGRGDYAFYYLPPDLWHLTSVQVIPLYILAGYVSIGVLRIARRSPVAATIGSTLVASVLVVAGLLVIQ